MHINERAGEVGGPTPGQRLFIENGGGGLLLLLSILLLFLLPIVFLLLPILFATLFMCVCFRKAWVCVHKVCVRV